jgi:hypothetical protein
VNVLQDKIPHIGRYFWLRHELRLMACYSMRGRENF